MKRLCLSLCMVLSFALFASMAVANAPVISPLPDIFIGDAEDNVGTIDNNLFRFSNALDLDNYVSDLDTTKDVLQWSFVESTTANDLSINGILQLDLLTEDPRTPGAKDIRAPHGTGTNGLITLRDLKDSPLPDALPYPAPTNPLNETVTFWVSDGANADSDDVIVQAVDEGTDRISAVPTGTPTPEPVVSYDFEGTADAWTFTGAAINSFDTQCAAATSNFDTHKLGVVIGTTTNNFGFWSSPGSALIAGDPGKLFLFQWQLNTNKTPATSVPTIRLRVNMANFSSDLTEAVTSSDGALSPPTSGTRTYNEFFMPIATGDMSMAFDVYGFDFAVENGTVFLEQADVLKMDPPATGWTPVSVPAFTSWTLLNGPGVYNNLAVATQSASALTLGSTGTTEDRGFAFWNSPVIPWTAGKFNRAVFTLSSATSPNTITGAVNAASGDFNWRLRLTFNGATVPGTTPTDYPLYFATESGANFFLAFEGYDFLPATNGTNTLSAVTLEQNDVIPLP